MLHRDSDRTEKVPWIGCSPMLRRAAPVTAGAELEEKREADSGYEALQGERNLPLGPRR